MSILKIFQTGPCELSWETLAVNPFRPINPSKSARLEFARIMGLVSNVSIFIWLYQSCQPRPYELLGFLTNWSLILSIIYLPVAMVAQHWPSKHKWTRYACIFGEVTACSEFLIAIFFWLILFPLMIVFDRTQEMALNVFLHLVPPITIWYDVFNNRLSFARQHLWHVLIYGHIYLAFNYVWSTVTGNPPYPVIDWQGPMTVVSILICYVFIFSCYAMARWQFIKKCKVSEEQKLLSCGSYNLETQFSSFQRDSVKVKAIEGDDDESISNSNASESTDVSNRSQRTSIDL